MASAPPSIDPADTGTFAGTMRAMMGKAVQNMDDMLPARVVAYDRASNRASVQPMIMIGTTDGRKLPRAQLASVPVLTMGGGGFLLSFPIKPGDFGWIKASDRDYSLFMQGLSEEWPNTKRMHSFQDGLFIPDIMRQWTLDGGDADAAVLQSADGAVRIALAAGMITMTAPTVTINGNVVVVGGDVTADGISLKTHIHSGVTAGGANSGAPVP